MRVTGKIRGVLMRKPGFWFFQITGWGLFYIESYFQSFKSLDSIEKFLLWSVSMLIQFLITILLRVIYRKVYIKRPSIYVMILVILAGSFAGALLSTLVNSTFQILINNWIVSRNVEVLKTQSVYLLTNRILFLTFPLLVWSTLYFGIKLWMELIEEKERSEKSALLAQTAQLKMLRYQLNPHFLFNSLNSIQALIYDDQQHADKMLTELSDFLRFTLRDTDRLFIPLKEEVDIINKYLSLEKARFPDRLEYEIKITERAAGIEVVAFILQPFVENAVRYGMFTSPENLKIEIRGFAEKNRLYLTVKNTGQWIEPTKEEGTGIKNVISRLNNAYPGKFRFTIDKEEKFVNITIEIFLSR